LEAEMADTNKKDEYDIFITQSIYPEAMSIFTSQLKSLEEIKDDCYIVLDTNVLLAPYIIGKEDPGRDNLLEECQRIYKSLIEKKCLIIPGQVAREFANRRVDKIAELYQQLSDKKAKIQQIPRGKYPLLNSLSEYQEVEHLQDEINKKIQEYQGAVSKVLAQIESWQLNDPVRSLYGQLFDESVIFDTQFDKEEIKKDLKRRQIHHIPPGYKDAGKGDSGVGDLLIWYTILELGKVHKKSVIFVSGDEKPDWFKQSQNVALHLRYELVDEFRRKSEGQSFHVVKFSRFLKLYGASDEIVEEVRLEEPLLTLQVGIDENTGLLLTREEAVELLAVGNTTYSVSKAKEICRVLGVKFSDDLIISWKDAIEAVKKYGIKAPDNEFHEAVFSLDLSNFIMEMLVLSMEGYLPRNPRARENAKAIAEKLGIENRLQSSKREDIT
jgi:hypothetical protein